jgi:hypothetical protein
MDESRLPRVIECAIVIQLVIGGGSVVPHHAVWYMLFDLFHYNRLGLGMKCCQLHASAPSGDKFRDFFEVSSEVDSLPRLRSSLQYDPIHQWKKWKWTWKDCG